MTESPLSSDLIVADVLRRWPATIRVFAARRMACVGCAMAPFMTLEEAARSYGMELGTFLADLRRAVGDRDGPGTEEEARP
jgi:hybrid cluster-associated redox disulfide protein